MNKDNVKTVVHVVTHTTLREVGSAACQYGAVKKVEEAVLDTTLADIGNCISDASSAVVHGVKGWFTSAAPQKVEKHEEKLFDAIIAGEYGHSAQMVLTNTAMDMEDSKKKVVDTLFDDPKFVELVSDAVTPKVIQSHFTK